MTTTTTIPTAALDGEWDRLNDTMRDEYERTRVTDEFDQRVAAKALDYLKEYGDDIPLSEADKAMDEFARSAADYFIDQETQRAECNTCGDSVPARSLSNVSDTSEPEWVCTNCLYTNGGN